MSSPSPYGAVQELSAFLVKELVAEKFPEFETLVAGQLAVLKTATTLIGNGCTAGAGSVARAFVERVPFILSTVSERQYKCAAAIAELAVTSLPATSYVGIMGLLVGATRLSSIVSAAQEIAANCFLAETTSGPARNEPDRVAKPQSAPSEGNGDVLMQSAPPPKQRGERPERPGYARHGDRSDPAGRDEKRTSRFEGPKEHRRPREPFRPGRDQPSDLAGGGLENGANGQVRDVRVNKPRQEPIRLPTIDIIGVWPRK